MLAREITVRTIESSGSGVLSFFEYGSDIPFSIERVYYIYDVPEGVQRGGHAHKRLNQILFCPYGAIEIILDDGKDRESIMLDDPSKAIIIQNLVWREMIWKTAGSVLVVGASMPYDEDDYIREYSEFIASLQDGGLSEMKNAESQA